MSIPSLNMQSIRVSDAAALLRTYPIKWLKCCKLVLSAAWGLLVGLCIRQPNQSISWQIHSLDTAADSSEDLHAPWGTRARLHCMFCQPCST